MNKIELRIFGHPCHQGLGAADQQKNHQDFFVSTVRVPDKHDQRTEAQYRRVKSEVECE